MNITIKLQQLLAHIGYIFKKIQKVAKSKPIKFLFETIFTGIIVSLIVSYLLSTPHVAMNNAVPHQHDDKVDLSFQFENIGQSSAKNIELAFLVGVDGATVDKFEQAHPNIGQLAEMGDNFSYTLPNLPSNRNFVILFEIKYDDSSKLRQLLNKLIMRNTYKIRKWSQYNFDRNKISMISLEQKKRYEKQLLEKLWNKK